MDINQLTKLYKVRQLNQMDGLSILELQKSNPLYFDYCPPEPNIQNILNDMTSLPPGKDIEDLYYVGFFEEENLVAILHFIISFPDKDTIYIGLFMVDRNYSGRGVGSKIINDALVCFRREGFLKARLGYMKGNPQAEAFWEKCGFVDNFIETENEQGKVIILEKNLN